MLLMEKRLLQQGVFFSRAHLSAFFHLMGFCARHKTLGTFFVERAAAAAHFLRGNYSIAPADFVPKPGKTLQRFFGVGVISGAFQAIIPAKCNFFFHNTPKNGECPAVRRGIGFIINQRR